MNILLWSQYFWPETFKINSLTAKLQSLGLSISVLTGKPNYPKGKIFPNYRFRGVQYEEYCSAQLIRIPLIPRRNNAFFLMLNYLSFIGFGFLYAPFLLYRKPLNLIFVYAPSPLIQALPAIFLARLKRIPLILWVQDLWPEALVSTGYIKNRWILALVRKLVKYVYQQADSILIQSEAFREPIQQLVKQGEKIHYYPNAAEIQSVTGLATEAEQELVRQLQATFAVVFTGNLGAVQSCPTILKAAELLKEQRSIHIFLIGEGSQRNWLQGEIELRGLTNISLCSPLPYTSMPSIYRAASALLVSLNDKPGVNATLPSKVSDYLASGKPIIASVNGETARILKQAQAGLVSKAEDPQGLADNILKLYGMSALARDKLGSNGVEYFTQNFALDTCAQNLINHFGQVANSFKEVRT